MFDNPDRSLNAFYEEASLDQNGNKQIWFEGETSEWYVLPQNSDYYNGSYDRLMRDTVKVADPYVDFSEYDRIIFVFWDQVDHAAAYTTKIRFETDDGIVWLTACFMDYDDNLFSPGTSQHEMGHNFGWEHGGGALLHEDGSFCAVEELVVGITSVPCVVHTYFDNNDIMGNGAKFCLPSSWRKKWAG